MYTQHQPYKSCIGLATDSGSTSNMSISVMTSISEQDERRASLDDDCPDYDAVVNRRRGFFPMAIYQYQCPNLPSSLIHDDIRTSVDSLPRGLKGMSITSERHISSGSSRRHPRPLPRHERYVYTYRLLANTAPLHFLISYAKCPFHP